MCRVMDTYAGVCRQELEDILNLVRVELNAGVDLENSKRALINHEFEASKKFLANNTASRIAIGVAAVSAVACVGIMGKGIYDALQAASRDKKPAITQLQAAEYHDTLLASPLKQTQL
jgi:hypothetical protein